MIDIVQVLRNKSTTEEIDLGFIKSCLSEYKYPKDLIKRLLRDKVLIRVKQRLFVFGPKYQRSLIVNETLANQIYGPSYISLEYALSYHGVIPERVETITCVTAKRNKRFDTPVGTFSYRTIPAAAYSAGIQRIEYDATHSILMASLEKAILDKFWLTRRSGIYNLKDFREFIYDDQRFDETELRKIKPRLLMEHAKKYDRVRMLKWATWLKGELG